MWIGRGELTQRYSWVVFIITVFMALCKEAFVVGGRVETPHQTNWRRSQLTLRQWTRSRSQSVSIQDSPWDTVRWSKCYTIWRSQDFSDNRNKKGWGDADWLRQKTAVRSGNKDTVSRPRLVEGSAKTDHSTERNVSNSNPFKSAPQTPIKNHPGYHRDRASVFSLSLVHTG